MSDSDFKRELDNWITREPEWEEEHDACGVCYACEYEYGFCRDCPCGECRNELDELARDEAIDRKKDGGW